MQSRVIFPNKTDTIQILTSKKDISDMDFYSSGTCFNSKIKISPDS